MTYVLVTPAVNELPKSQDQLKNGIRMQGTKRAELLVEGARMLDEIGLSEGWVRNISAVRILAGVNIKPVIYETRQSWFLFKNEYGWFFKQAYHCKGRRAILGV